jgi:Cysteine-rich secretory protein family
VRPTLAGAHVFAAALAATVVLGTLPGLSALAATVVGGNYHPLQPARILDTRDGTGGVAVAPLRGGGLLTVQVAGRGLVPASGAAAVVLNVTVTNSTAASYLTVFPAGVAMPLASNLNWTRGQTVPNLVVVALGTGTQAGQVTAFNSTGSVDVLFDVAGYYSTPGQSLGPDGLFNPLVPVRLLDTRSAGFTPLGPGQTQTLQVTGSGGVPAAGVSAVVLNLTVTGSTGAGYITAWPSGATRPSASNLNFVAGQTVANRAVIKLSPDGKVDFYNAQGTVQLIVDVNGWFTDSSASGTGSSFSPMAPVRVLDSRTGAGGFTDPWGPKSGRALTVAGVGGVPAMTDPNPPTAVVANITVTDTTASSFLTGWPDGAAQPAASDLNWTRGTTVANLAVIQVGPTGKIDMYDAAGCTDVIVDVVGWFTGPMPVTTAGPPPTAIPCPGWLSRLNYWRSTAGLAPLSENSVWSSGDRLHSAYMVKNQLVTHYETAGTPYYTVAGDAAARNGNIEVGSNLAFTDEQAIDFWMQAPFHAMGMMDPRLQQTGFGAYRQTRSGWQAGFTLDVIRGNSFTGGQYPVYWPGNGKTVPLRSYTGGESPDPLQACPGYSVPTGLPVFVQVAGNIATSVSAHSFTGNGVALAHCVIDSNSAGLGTYLTQRGGVIVIPRQPLQPGVVYGVSVTVNGVPRSWTFQVS